MYRVEAVLSKLLDAPDVTETAYLTPPSRAWTTTAAFGSNWRRRSASWRSSRFRTRCPRQELWLAGQLVAKFDLLKDFSKDFSEWRFADVRALRVGPWMKDVIDIATQIEVRREKEHRRLFDNRTLETANNIDLS